MKPIQTWIVVADGARARIFSHKGPGKPLEQVLDQDFIGDKRPAHDLGTDRPGRSHQRMGAVHHAMEPHEDLHQLEKRNFAKRVAKILDEATQKKTMDRLVLIAPAKTLGDLRAALSKQTMGLVTAEATKDLTHVSLKELPSHLDQLIVI